MSYENPAKTVSIKRPVSEVRNAFIDITKNLKTVTLALRNDDFNYLQLETAANGGNLGAILEISLNPVSESMTEVRFVSRRKVDFVSSRWEYDHCQQVITDCMNLASKSMAGELKPVG